MKKTASVKQSGRRWSFEMSAKDARRLDEVSKFQGVTPEDFVSHALQHSLPALLAAPANAAELSEQEARIQRQEKLAQQAKLSDFRDQTLEEAKRNLDSLGIKPVQAYDAHAHFWGFGYQGDKLVLYNASHMRGTAEPLSIKDSIEVYSTLLKSTTLTGQDGASWDDEAMDLWLAEVSAAIPA